MTTKSSQITKEIIKMKSKYIFGKDGIDSQIVKCVAKL